MVWVAFGAGACGTDVFALVCLARVSSVVMILVF